MGDLNHKTKLGQPALYRILDANLDRAREGIRTIEEWFRFGLDNSEMAAECKNLRQQLAQWHSNELRMSRDTTTDVGTQLSHPSEENRESLEQVIQVNFCRVEEALRVLEEYGKVYHPNMGAAVKQMRYRVYTLESNLLAYGRHQTLQRANLYLVTSPSERLMSVVEAALQGGLKVVQYRDKDTDDHQRWKNARQLCQLCHRYNALFLVNDRVDIAIAVNADGVHLGQQDLPIAVAKQLLGPQKIVGKSTTNPEEMKLAIAEGADYIGVGPVYATPTKPDKQAAGLEYVRHATRHASVPWFAIGGINMNNFDDVLMAGATRVAVVRSLMQAEQPTLVTQYFLSQFTRVQTLRDRQILPENAPADFS
ncbi:MULTISPECIES: thiamine phosphate synthase [Arthrospira]|uniref:Thiamine-phosphate synthase n=1 Tax=Limnospira platensis NIES-46 TaxID=1236695 RepID=A0A5M3T9M8_LIMPL|nr:thiamine phosphate synthase [Arthrospira platensis]AMW31825.1 thiamine-phosphate pyrophosphorylase [Arthrospira platensis YZ]KDR55235.1 thiamine-phosphate pyrophosphorylase [Arthrospira platensis str. Paraca]MBD2667677.1 thiamine phosphate synthase [Arthrospira platensis FACHB-439]MBD2708995.1 thiamine phosphate synthase [Arthrospira platensis FACHB-835]MDF2208178.1 thiamine phosphate synthase [Arthrospira platensis NCB002]MDT9295520.1 thiamine phosphate synthase [Arthrospira platensis PCC